MSVRLVKIIDPTAIVVGGLVPKGAYSGVTAYSVGDSVSYNGSSYVCITASTGNLPTDTAYWQLVASKGDTGATGLTGATGATGAPGVIQTVNGKTGTSITLDKTDVGLGNVDNTSDANKPVSTAQQTALNAKANASDTVNLTGDQTIAGVKTFTSAPIAPSGTSIGGVLHLTGTGFPEGVVTAPTGSIYIDTAVTNGASSWIKKSGTGNTGWQVLDGDTGWRRNDPANSWFLNGATPNADGDPGTRFRRYGNVVHFILGLTTPSGWTNGADFLAVPNGFRHPNTLGYMPGGYSTASSMAVVSTGTTMRFYSGVTSSARFQWTWITNDPWPTALPGIAA